MEEVKRLLMNVSQLLSLVLCVVFYYKVARITDFFFSREKHLINRFDKKYAAVFFRVKR